MKPETVLKYLRIARKEINHSKNGAFYEYAKIERGLDAAIEFLEGIKNND